MIKKIEYRSKSQQTYDTILNAIINEELKPEDNLSETILAERLNVSRTPVREALRKLDGEGFISLRPGATFVINTFSGEDAIEALFVRRLLEGEATRLAAENCSLEFLEQLQKNQQHGTLCLTRNDSDVSHDFMKTDIEFHHMIFEMSGNKYLPRASEAIRDRQMRFYIAKKTIGDLYEDCLEQHKRIIDAIERHDCKQAEEFAKDHIDYIINMVKSL